MSPEAKLADLVEAFLSRDRMPAPFIAAVARGVSDIGDALGEAADKTGNWGGMLAKLRSGAALVRSGVERLRNEPGLERFLKYAESRAAFAEAMIDEILRLRADEPTLVR